jgi:predicted phage terminase large subunit-like protein
MAAKRETIEQQIERAREASRRALSVVEPEQTLAGGVKPPEGVPAWSKYIPHSPTEKQRQFLALTCKEAMFGGAAGGGKSDALLMAALMFVEVPSYAAIIFQRALTDFALPGGLIDRAHDWLGGTDAKWDEQSKTWTFPSGATLTFGYIKNYRDCLRYKSTEFQFVGFEELTRYREKEYRYLFSRLRKKKVLDKSHLPSGATEEVIEALKRMWASLPLRMRGVTNPGDIGHEWVKQRFIVEGEQAGRVFIPALAAENPHLDQEEYEASLNELDAVTRQQLKSGNWDVRPSGGYFDRAQFGRFKKDEAPLFRKLIRWHDLAATAPAPGKDPDWTASALIGFHAGRYYILDVRRMRGAPGEVYKYLKQTAIEDRRLYGRKVETYIEQEPGSSGIFTIDYLVREVLHGYAVRGKRSTGSKLDYAKPLSAAAANGNVLLLEGGKWHNLFFDEAEAFTGDDGGAHDDVIDAVSKGGAVLSGGKSKKGFGF